MPFKIICPLCGINDDGEAITSYRDAINNQAWIHYAKHIIKEHPDNFRVHWAIHALEDKKIKFDMPDLSTVDEPIEPKPNIEIKKPVDTITEYLQKRKVVPEKVTVKANVEKIAREIVPGKNGNNGSKGNGDDKLLSDTPDYDRELEEENPFKDQPPKRNSRKNN